MNTHREKKRQRTRGGPTAVYGARELNVTIEARRDHVTRKKSTIRNSEVLHTEYPNPLLRVVVNELRILSFGHLLDLLTVATPRSVVLHL